MSRMIDSVKARVAVIGAGYWGKNLVRNFAELGVLAAIVESDPNRARDLSEKHVTPVMTLDAALGNDAINAVAIAAPAAKHFELSRAALEAGKHVYVEKPLSLTVADGQALVSLAAERDRRLMVGHLLQYHPAFVVLLDFVRGGRLGELRSVHSSRLNFGKFRREEDILWSFAPHDISMILALAATEPKKVSAVATYALRETSADICHIDLTFAGALRAHVTASWISPFKEQKLVVVGSKAMAVFDDLEPWERKLMLYQHVVDWQDGIPVARPAKGEPVAVASSEPLRAECQHFIDCLAGGIVPRTDGQEGLRVLAVLAAAAEAMRPR